MALTFEPRTDLSVDDIDLSDPLFWAQPEEEREGAFALLRRERPISFHEERDYGLFPQGPGYWALSRHQDVLDASRQADLFCSGKGSNIGDMPEAFLEFFGSMINMDDPRHARLRRIVSKGFTPRHLEAVMDSVAERATKIVDDLIEKGSCDFVTDVAAALPLAIICDMMGIPESQHEFVFSRTNVILGAGDPEYGPEDINEVVGALLTAGAELNQLVQELGEERKKHPTDDLTSALVNADVDGELLDDTELGSFFVLLVVAGNETTRNAIAHGMKALCDHPAERARWMADFDGLAPTAVEEIVRWATPVIHFRRTVTADTTLAGQPLRAGEKVIMWYSSANRDEAVFDAPERFDVTRTPNDHVGFGGPGPHFCLGAQLARREITVMFRELFRRLPDLEVVGEPAYLESNFINGIKHLPCEFTPGGAREA
jgi:cytochrome P450